MTSDEQPASPAAPPDVARPASSSGMWQPPTVGALQTLLPQYEIISIIGRGGMGAVYKGRQKSLTRIVAIKILPPGMADDDLKFAQRFQNEARTMAAMNHPAIVSVHDFGETADGLLYFVMEFVDGTDVQKMIQASGRLSGESALAITTRVCEALAYAHSRGVIHRDIKPANILINQENHLKVADFGLAKLQTDIADGQMTRSSVVMGSPDFIAPEGLKRGGAVDHRADIFGVGVMLYQMLTGELPRGLFKVPSRLVPGLDERFDAIVCKAMEPDPADRQQSAQELLAELEALKTPQPARKSRGGARVMVYAVSAVLVITAGFALMQSTDKPTGVKSIAADESPWQPIFDKPEDYIGKRATFKDGWASLTDRPLTIGREMRDGAVRATTRYLKSGVGSLAVRANQNGHIPITAFISGEGRIIALNFWPDYQSKDSQRREFPLPKPLTEGEEFTMELSARGNEFTVSVNGVEVGRAHRELPGIIAGTMGVIPTASATVEFKDIAWREFPASEPSR